MSLPKLSRHRIAAAVAMICAGLALASTADAVDVRDWGRKFPTGERLVLLAQFNNEAVLDKETQLVWQRYWPNNAVAQRDAYRFCNYSTSGGRSGWRLPTVTELYSLMDPGVSGPIKLPAGHPFRTADDQPLPVSRILWTSTFDRRSPQAVGVASSYWYWVFTLSGIDAFSIGSSSAYNYLCVRGAVTANEN